MLQLFLFNKFFLEISNILKNSKRINIWSLKVSCLYPKVIKTNNTVKLFFPSINHWDPVWIHYLKSKNIFSIYSGIIFIGGTILNISVNFIVGIIWVHFWEIKNRFFLLHEKYLYILIIKLVTILPFYKKNLFWFI